MREGTCERCGKQAPVNWVWLSWNGEILARTRQEVCAECFEVVPHDHNRPAPHNSPATREDAPPSWDNVVRAYEEDRP